MKLKLVVSFKSDTKPNIKILSMVDHLITIKIVLEPNIFDSVQQIKTFIKKYLLSQALDLLEIEIAPESVEFEADATKLLMLDTMIYIAIDQYQELKYITYKLDFDTSKYQSYLIFKSIIIKYINACFSTSNEMNPETWTKYLSAICQELVLDKKYIIRDNIANQDNFPLIYSVGKGSKYNPRLFVCAFGVENDSELYTTVYDQCLIGKGVTFDTGGYCVKTAEGMLNMSIDKFGSALGFFTSLYNYLAYNIKTIFISPIVENMIDGSAYLPGEIIKTKLSVNVHVDHTDAEGRLILADAVEYAVSNFKFKYCFTIATLTYAAIISVGYHRTAYLTSDNMLDNTIQKISNVTGEKIHRLPNDKYYLKQLQTNIRHRQVLKSTAPLREAGTVIGGVFVEYFYDNAYKMLNKAPKPSFCHFDIAALANLDYFGSLSYSYNLFFMAKLCKELTYSK